MSGRLPLLLCLTMILTVTTVVVLAHRLPTISQHRDHEVARQQSINGSFLYDGGFVDDVDYVLMGQLPYANHARGGVFFIGDSQMRTSIMPWRLSPEERALIHNYSLGDLRHREQRAFVRMLVEEFGLLDGGVENTTIILGASYYMARHKDYSDPTLFLYGAVERHGLYVYGDGDGFHRTRLTALERFYKEQRDYAFRFLSIVAGQRNTRVKPPSPIQQTVASRTLHYEWREPMRREVAEFAALLDYLGERNVRVRVLINPSGSWDNETPYEQAYRDLITPVLAARNVTLIDQSDIFPDMLFSDGEHTTYRGQQILHQIDRQIALRELAEMGVAPVAANGNPSR